MKEEHDTPNTQPARALHPRGPAAPVWLGFCWIPYLYAHKDRSGNDAATKVPLPQSQEENNDNNLTR